MKQKLLVFSIILVLLSSANDSLASSKLPSLFVPLNTQESDFQLSLNVSELVCPFPQGNLIENPQGKYCVAAVKVTNTGNNPVTLNWHGASVDPFEVIDSQNRTYGIVGGYMESYFTESLNEIETPPDRYLADLGPGFSQIYFVPFDIPVNDHIVAIRYSGNWDNSKPIIWYNIICKPEKGGKIKQKICKTQY